MKQKPLVYRILLALRDDNIKDTKPHQDRQAAIKTLILAILGFMALTYIWGCSPQRGGCHATKGMSGYGWIKCKESGKVSVLAPDGSIVCCYYESVK